MRIGIDIDDTITDTWKYIIPYYEKEFGLSKNALENSLPYYNSLKGVISLEEYFNRVKKINKEIILNVPIKKDAVSVINKLYDEGNEIYLITSRGYDENDDPFGDTSQYLSNHGIKYTKLLVHSRNKAIICKEFHIDLLIDDSLKHAGMVALENIPVLLFETNYNRNDKLYKHVKSWKEIYDVIKGMR